MVRHVRSSTIAGIAAGTTNDAARTADEIEAAKDEDDGLRSRGSDEAQQLSAWAWVTIRCDADPPFSDLCIGQAPSTQHAMRASGVANQPAQTATSPADSERTARHATRRRRKNCTVPKDARRAEACQTGNRDLLGILQAAPRFRAEIWTSTGATSRISSMQNSGWLVQSKTCLRLPRNIATRKQAQR